MKVVKLQEHELEQATEVMSDAFATDPLMLWVFGSKDKYFNYSKPVFKSWIKYTLLYGEAYRTENFGSVALIKLPGITDFSLWGLFRSGMIFNIFYLGFSGWNRLLKFDELSTAHAKQNMKGNPYWYLWMLGTKTNVQGQGLGRSVLKSIDDTIVKNHGEHCYLDATSENSVLLYSKTGYKTLNFFTLPETKINITCMDKQYEVTL